MIASTVPAGSCSSPFTERRQAAGDDADPLVRGRLLPLFHGPPLQVLESGPRVGFCSTTTEGASRRKVSATWRRQQCHFATK
jgi:hypothetical protein